MINGNGLFGPTIDFSKEFAHEYVQSTNSHWLNEYHVDGFRYDEVTDLYDGPTGIKSPGSPTKHIIHRSLCPAFLPRVAWLLGNTAVSFSVPKN
jgi:1,4-alpha-glucan branching enzyme